MKCSRLADPTFARRPGHASRAELRVLLVGPIMIANASALASSVVTVAMDDAALVRAADRLIDACHDQIPEGER